MKREPGVPMKRSGEIAIRRLKLLLVADKADCSPEERTIGSMTDGVIRCLETCMVREKLDQYCQYFEAGG